MANYDNSEYPAVQIASGGRNEERVIMNSTIYNKMVQYVK